MNPKKRISLDLLFTIFTIYLDPSLIFRFPYDGVSYKKDFVNSLQNVSIGLGLGLKSLPETKHYSLLLSINHKKKV